VRRRRGIQLVEELAHLSTLFFRPFQDGRTTADVRVLLLDLRRATLGDDRREYTLGRERDQVVVME
jgi:hypothetical protein